MTSVYNRPGSSHPGNQRRVVPLAGGISSTASAPLDPSEGSAAVRTAANTAHLESQVRLLEQEVHLLREGLAQNERLRQAPTSAKRVRFGTATDVLQSSTAVHAPASAAPATVAGGTPVKEELTARPRLAFGQRVNPTQPRASPSGSFGSSVSPSRRSNSLTRVKRSTTQGLTTTAAVRAHASTLGSCNTSGIPLQASAAGGTVVSPRESDRAQPPAATVWASANPETLWPRGAAAATVASGVCPSPSSFPGRGDVACYPFRSTVHRFDRETPPIEVTMSSESPLHFSLPAGCTAAAASAPPSMPEGPTATATTAISATTVAGAATSALVAAPASSHETDVSVLRDALAQRETFLHRVLLELHNSTAGTAVRPAAMIGMQAESSDRSGLALRLVTEELLSVQKQLSQTRTAYQLVVSELRESRRSLQAASSPPEPVPQPRPATPAASQGPSEPPAAATTPSAPPVPGPSLQSQLDVALKKLKAWEDWFNSSAERQSSNAAIDVASPSPEKRRDASRKSPRDDAAPMASEAHAPTRKKKRTPRHSALPEDGALPHCPHCGLLLQRAMVVPDPLGRAGLSQSFLTFLPAEPPNLVSSSSAPQRTLAAPTTSAPPYTSAYTFDSALHNRLVNHHSGTTVAAGGPPLGMHNHGWSSKGDACDALGATATPPPPVASSSAPAVQEQVGAKAALTFTSEKEKRSEAGDAHVSGQYDSPRQVVPWNDSGAVTQAVCASPLCDGLAHAQQQSQRVQRYISLMAREAAVRDMAETERLVAEQRLTFQEQWRMQFTAAAAATASPPPPPSSSTP